MKKRIVVICPGRGSYTKETLGYLQKYGHSQKDFLSHLDESRRLSLEPTITELDSTDQFKVSVHTKGEHASPLIYACANIDFQSINLEKFEIAAVCGNSMGWYLSLALGGSLDWNGAFQLIQTMGSMMKTGLVGGQVIYSVTREDWAYAPDLEAEALCTANECGAELSIRLGGYLVFGGTPEALKSLIEKLPKRGDTPFQLINHGAFHTSLMHEISRAAFEMIPSEIFHAPKVPLIDGNGKIWQPYSTDVRRLYEYTLNTQVLKPYDFSRSIEVALKEFAPDHLVLLGPGGSLGGSLGQILIKNHWLDLKSKTDFQELQKTNPFLVSMGMPEQRALLL